MLYLELLGVTVRDSPTNWNKLFVDSMEKALKRMHILRVCKRNGYSLSDLDYLFNCLIMSLFSDSITVWGVSCGLYQIPVKLIGYWERLFDLGIFNMKHRSNRLLKTGIWGSEKVLWVLPRIPFRISLPPPPPFFQRGGLYAVSRILTRSHVLILKCLKAHCQP